jgi:hypothetical protein
MQVQSADNVTTVRPEAVIMTTSDRIVSGKWLHKSIIKVHFWDTLCLQHQFCNYGHARCSKWPLRSLEHSKICEKHRLSNLPSLVGQSWCSTTLDAHNRSVRAHRSDIPARSWKN